MLIALLILIIILVNTWTTIATITRDRAISSKDLGIIAICSIFSYPLCQLIFQIFDDRLDEIKECSNNE